MEGTKKLIHAMEKKISEYGEKTGKEMDEVLKTTAGIDIHVSTLSLRGSGK